MGSAITEQEIQDIIEAQQLKRYCVIGNARRDNLMIWDNLVVWNGDRYVTCLSEAYLYKERHHSFEQLIDTEEVKNKRVIMLCDARAIWPTEFLVSNAEPTAFEEYMNKYDQIVNIVSEGITSGLDDITIVGAVIDYYKKQNRHVGCNDAISIIHSLYMKYVNM